MPGYYRRPRAYTAYEQRAEFDPWESRAKEQTQIYSLKDYKRNACATQTDTDVELLPYVSTEKATMTELVPKQHSFRSPSVPPRCFTPGPPVHNDPGMMVPYNTFYQRLAKSEVYPVYASKSKKSRGVESQPPVFKAGRLGAPWRHVKQTTGNLGNHICFIDGSVKEHDMHRYPPYGYMKTAEPEPEMYYTYIPVRQKSAPPRKPQKEKKFYTAYNNHAKNGFQYWYQEKEPPKLRPNQTIQGRLMKVGCGY